MKCTFSEGNSFKRKDIIILHPSTVLKIKWNSQMGNWMLHCSFIGKVYFSCSFENNLFKLLNVAYAKILNDIYWTFSLISQHFATGSSLKITPMIHGKKYCLWRINWLTVACRITGDKNITGSVINDVWFGVHRSLLISEVCYGLQCYQGQYSSSIHLLLSHFLQQRVIWILPRKLSHGKITMRHGNQKMIYTFVTETTVYCLMCISTTGLNK